VIELNCYLAKRRQKSKGGRKSGAVATDLVLLLGELV